MKTDRAGQRVQGLVDLESGTERRAHGTKVRTRCKGKRQMEREVEQQMAAAMPYIVRAQVEKAKEGSLMHAKWLCGVLENAGAGQEGSERAKQSLALLLMEQLQPGGKS